MSQTPSPPSVLRSPPLLLSYFANGAHTACVTQRNAKQKFHDAVVLAGISLFMNHPAAQLHRGRPASLSKEASPGRPIDRPALLVEFRRWMYERRETQDETLDTYDIPLRIFLNILEAHQKGWMLGFCDSAFYFYTTPRPRAMR